VENWYTSNGPNPSNQNNYRNQFEGEKLKHDEAADNDKIPALDPAKLHNIIELTDDHELLREIARMVPGLISYHDKLRDIFGERHDVARKFGGIVSLQEIIDTDFPEPQLLIEGLMNVGEIGLFIGRQKEGKSTLTLQLAIDVACGDRFLDRFETRESVVLYIDYENRLNQLKKRGVDLTRGRPSELVKIKAYDYIADRDLGLEGKHYKNLQHWTQILRPRLLVIDPLRLALPGAGFDLKDDKAAVEIIDQLSKLQKLNPGMAVLLVHHVKKTQTQDRQLKLKLRDDPRTWIDKIYGSQALLGHAETIWGFEEDGDGYTFATVPRSHEPLILSLEKGPDSERFLLSTNGEPNFKTENQRQIWLKLPQEFSWSEGVKVVGSKNTLDRIIRQAKAQGFLIQDPTTKRLRKLGANLLARPEGFEPPTPRSVVWCSVQLSYGRSTDVAEREGFEPSVPFWGTHA
jgi:AAA domain